MTSQVVAIAIDSRSPRSHAAFWRAALGYETERRWRDAHGAEYVEVCADCGPLLLFQPVADTKSGKNRLHLDIAPTDIDQYAEIERLLDLGAQLVADDAEFPWVVLADPEGNEFCVLPSR